MVVMMLEAVLHVTTMPRTEPAVKRVVEMLQL